MLGVDWPQGCARWVRACLGRRMCKPRRVPLPLRGQFGVLALVASRPPPQHDILGDTQRGRGQTDTASLSDGALGTGRIGRGYSRGCIQGFPLEDLHKYSITVFE